MPDLLREAHAGIMPHELEPQGPEGVCETSSTTLGTLPLTARRLRSLKGASVIHGSPTCQALLGWPIVRDPGVAAQHTKRLGGPPDAAAPRRDAGKERQAYSPISRHLNPEVDAERQRPPGLG
jgi:hypothetical protein